MTRSEENTGPTGATWRCLVAVSSLVPAPLLVFISSSNRLYSNNRAQLDHQVSVLAPFVALFAIALALGLLLYFASRWRPLRFALWGYYLAAPFFLLSRFLDGPFILLVVFVAAVSGLSFALDPRSGAKLSAVFGIVLLMGEAWVFADVTARPGRSGESLPALKAPDGITDEALPNVYHLVLDGFQAEVFEAVLSADVEKALGGFIYFPENTSVYHSTVSSLASTFGSRRYAYDVPQSRWVEEALNGKSSLVSRLKGIGYRTRALVPAAEDFRGPRLTVPHEVVGHESYAGASLKEMNTRAFVRLWSFGVVPRGLREWLGTEGGPFDADPSDLKRLEEGRFLSYSAPVVSALSFDRLIAEEAELAPRGRYSFIHLLVPHPPYVLRGDCSYDTEGSKTDWQQQADCTMKLLLELTARLHELDRFDDSLIVVHGDHGSRLRVENGVFAESRSRSLRALLLVKPAGRGGSERLEVSPAKTSLLDIAPFVLDCVGAAPSADYEGKSFGAVAPCTKASTR